MFGEDGNLFGVAGLDGADDELGVLRVREIIHVDHVLTQVNGDDTCDGRF